MFGFILGTLCLIALVATLRRRHYGRYAFAHGYFHGPEPYGGYAYGPPWGRHGHHGRGVVLRVLFERLDTTPGQEKAIVQTVEAARERLRATREELTSARKTLATAIGGDVIDGQSLDAAIEQQKSIAQKFGQELTQALLNTHEVLHGKQRQKLAELIVDGPGWRGPRYF